MCDLATHTYIIISQIRSHTHTHSPPNQKTQLNTTQHNREESRVYPGAKRAHERGRERERDREGKREGGEEGEEEIQLGRELAAAAASGGRCVSYV